MSESEPARRRPAPAPLDEAPAIPGYRIEGVLGRGSSGVVYRARQLAVERDVALKVLHAELSARTRTVQRLQREARTSARLAHPNLVSAIDMGETDGRWWFAMELVDGPSLAERLQAEGPLDERQALRLFLPLCEALEHLWRNGVVHRDIKPANILVDVKGGARLADLGLAFGDDDPSVTAIGGTLGTPHYISPEQALDPKSADVRSDIWSFGATLFHAVCGRPPFAGTSTAEILSAVLYERIPDPLELAPELSKGFALVLRKCLVRDVANRYATPRELRLDLERVRERRAPRVRSARLDPVRRERATRGAWLWAGALVLCVAFAWRFVDTRPAVPGGAARAERPAEDRVERLRARLERGESPAVLLATLEGERATLPAELSASAEALEVRLRSALAAALAGLRRGLEVELDRLLAQDDFAGARSLLGAELTTRVRALSGPASLAPDEEQRLERWRAEALRSIEAREDQALAQVEERLARWRRGRLARADELVERGLWDEARALLQPSDEELLAAAEADALCLDPRSEGRPEDWQPLEELLSRESLAFRLRRQRLDDDWNRLDTGLRRALQEESAALSAELSGPSGAPLRGQAAEWGRRLREAFAGQLAVRGLSVEHMPEGLPHTALELLEDEALALERAARERREEALREELAEIEQMGARFARRREYAAAAELWEETLPLFEATRGEELGEDEAARRAELTRRVRLRRDEALALQQLAEEVVGAVRALDGRVADVRLGNILYPDTRVEVDEPLWRRGFRLVGRPGRLYVQTLPRTTFEELAGLAPLSSTSAIGRVRLASFRLAEGDPRAAREALLAGPLAQSEPWKSIGAELEERIERSIDRERSQAAEREAEAAPLLEVALDEERARDTPRSVLARIERLLEDYGDVSSVERARERLLALRDELRGSAERDDAASFHAAYEPTALAFPGGERVQLAFDFAGPSAGSWEAGDWVSDGAAWTLAGGVHSWEELARERGARLVLRPPLDVERGTLDVRLAFEGPLASEPRLLVVSCAGFHVALVGPALPGADREPRWLAATGSLAAFLERVRAGEGTRVRSLVERGARHELGLVLQPRQGRIEVFFDGELLGSAHPSPPSTETAVLSLRSWEPVRLLRAVLEADR